MRRSYGTLKQNSLCATHEMSLRDMNSTEEVFIVFAFMSRRDIS